MDLSSKKAIQGLLSSLNIKPSKGMGQNFLVNQKVLAKIIEAAHIGSSDIVVEVGPGMGVLTQELAKRAKKIIAIEKDGNMVEILKQALKDCPNVEIIHGDILKFNPQRSILKATPYKIVANIPYYLTSPLIRTFLEAENPPQSIVLMIQKEVAQRICSSPPDMSLLAVSVQFYAKPKIISYTSKESFWPVPSVDSAIIKIDNIKKPKGINSDQFFSIVKAGFSQPRKQLINNLSRGLKKDRGNVGRILLKNDIQPNQRAETLTVENWIKLTHSF